MHTMIARSRKQESMSEDGVFWWKEWQWDGFYIQQRYLSQLPTGEVCKKGCFFTAPEFAWEQWISGDSMHEAIANALGDTSFRHAESLCEEHAQEKAKLCAEIANREIIRRAEERVESAKKSLYEFKMNEQRLFNKRHGDKTGDAFEKARQRTLKRIRPTLDGLEADARAAVEHLAELTK